MIFVNNDKKDINLGTSLLNFCSDSFKTVKQHLIVSLFCFKKYNAKKTQENF